MKIRTRLRRVRPLTATVALVAALIVVPVAGTTGRYADAAGDSGTAPDLTGVTVAGDALGQVVLTISVNQVPAQGDVGVMLVLDTDLDPRTGEPTHGGADFVFVEDMVARKWSFGRWTGAAWDWDTPYATAEVWSSPTAVTISVNRSELGNSSAFNFYAISWLDELVDSAPDRGLWNYSFAADGPEIRRVLTATTPRSGPAAGKRFTFTPIGVELPPSAEPLLLVPRPESYSCRAKLAGRALRGSRAGRCSWTIPKSARKHKLAVVVTVAYGGATKTFTFAYRVK